jgi:hypothetical protein
VLLVALPGDFTGHFSPLLQAAGADPKRILTGPAYVIPDDFNRLERDITRNQVDVVIISNVFAYLAPGVKPSYDADCLPIVRMFKEIADRTGAAIILSRGIQKTASNSKKPLAPTHRGTGAPAWAGGADVVLSLGRDGDTVTLDTVRLKSATKPQVLNAELIEIPAVDCLQVTFPDYPEASPPK